MKLLLDTQAAIWAAGQAERLGDSAREGLLDPDNMILLSAVVPWEIAIKQGLGKLKVDDGYIDLLMRGGAEPLPVDFRHAQGVERLPFHHRDPFDRLLISQALVEDATIVTSDPLIGRYDVPVLW